MVKSNHLASFHMDSTLQLIFWPWTDTYFQCWRRERRPSEKLGEHVQGQGGPKEYVVFWEPGVLWLNQSRVATDEARKLAGGGS